MDDLISRAALLEKLRELDELFARRAASEDARFKVVQVGITLASCEVDAVPAVAAEIVRHGRWIQENIGPFKSECSVCRTTFNTHMEYGLGTERCPHCAAVMDVEEGANV